ncbi:prohibitin-2-like [Zophobas morio]|uniref:prohibitin-2-like n=1 Tax=Zophobas morio TaxID=2755281 RepID=UPI003083C4B6
MTLNPPHGVQKFPGVKDEEDALQIIACTPFPHSLSPQLFNPWYLLYMNNPGQLRALGRFGAVFASVGALGIYAFKNSIYTVDGGERAVIFSRIGGVQEGIISEGTHFCIPWLQRPIIYDTRAKVRRISTPTGSKDLQIVNITLRILCRPDKEKLHLITKEIGPDWDERILPSICNEVLKLVVAQFNVSQLNSQREQISRLISQQLSLRCSEFHIVLDDISITEINFSPVYMAAVEAKQIAQQEAQRAQFTVEMAKQEAQRKIVRARGEAKAAEVIGKQIAGNPAYLHNRKIDAAVTMSNIMSKSQNKVVLDSDALILNVQEVLLK